MRSIRFWLSRAIFETILGRSRADILGPRIDAKTTKYNLNRGPWRCYSCGSGDLVRDRSGSDGFISWPHYFYRCSKCHNTQDTPGNLGWLSDRNELERHRLTKDGLGYHIFLRDWQWAALIWVFLAVVWLIAIWWVFD